MRIDIKVRGLLLVVTLDYPRYGDLTALYPWRNGRLLA